MNSSMYRSLNIVAAIGLALGVVFGLTGTMVTQPSLQNTLWAIDSVGLVVATALLALRYFRNQTDFAAAGSLVFCNWRGRNTLRDSYGPQATSTHCGCDIRVREVVSCVGRMGLEAGRLGRSK